MFNAVIDVGFNYTILLFLFIPAIVFLSLFLVFFWVDQIFFSIILKFLSKILITVWCFFTKVLCALLLTHIVFTYVKSLQSSVIIFVLNSHMYFRGIKICIISCIYTHLYVSSLQYFCVDFNFYLISVPFHPKHFI